MIYFLYYSLTVFALKRIIPTYPEPVTNVDLYCICPAAEMLKVTPASPTKLLEISQLAPS
jgi:hypothetical protein